LRYQTALSILFLTFRKVKNRTHSLAVWSITKEVCMKEELSIECTMTMLNKVLDIPNDLHGKQYLEEVAYKIWKVFEFEYVFMGYEINPKSESIQTVVTFFRGQLIENFVYDLKDKSGKGLFSGHQVCIHPKGGAKALPENVMHTNMEGQCYIGDPTIVNGNIFGLLAVLDSHGKNDNTYFHSLIDFMASRISIELERYINHLQIEDLRKQAKTDEITGLLSRNEFDLAVETIARKYPKSMSAVMFIDADNFTQVDDSLGYQLGDDVLRMLASKLSSSIRKGDLIARCRAEEFVIFLPVSDVNITEEIAERIRTNLKNNEIAPVTVSIGVSLGYTNEPLKNIIRRADEAVYTAKHNGKNQTQYNTLELEVMA